MPAVRLLPDVQTLQRYLDEGLTHQQIADRVFMETGNRVSRSSVSAAISRAGLSAEGTRYQDVIPWRVSVRHIKEYPVRMLRLLGRRRSGGVLTAAEDARLQRWLDTLVEEDAVVAYAPDAEVGFHYIDRGPDDPVDVPIRRRPIRLK